MMHRVILSSIAAVMVFALSGCASEGEVYAKEFTPSYTTFVMQPIYSTQCTPGVNGTTTCRQVQTGTQNTPIFHQECFEVKFRNDEGDKGSDCVSKEVYDSIKIGDWYER